MTSKQDELKAWILSFDTGKTWYNKLVSDATKRAYLPQFKRYCDYLKKNPDSSCCDVFLAEQKIR